MRTLIIVAVVAAFALMGCEDETCESACFDDWQLSFCQTCAEGLVLERDCIDIWCSGAPTCSHICEDSAALASCQQCTIDGGDEENCVALWCD
jgi:outer membrane lipoprotein SlyB